MKTAAFKRALGDEAIGQEARVQPGDHSAVRLWLRLLSCATEIEQEIRTRLRTRLGTTLARFDYLAQLERHPDGLRMNALSRYLMVTGGNVTALTDQLEQDGFVRREPDPNDRRSQLLRLTPEGRERFLAMAAEHETWLVELLGGFEHKTELLELLGQLRLHLSKGPHESGT
jgi:DNA-binding MarR family transcriptional regulator